MPPRFQHQQRALQPPRHARHGRLLKMGRARVSPHPWDERIGGLSLCPHLLSRFQHHQGGATATHPRPTCMSANNEARGGFRHARPASYTSTCASPLSNPPNVCPTATQGVGGVSGMETRESVELQNHTHTHTHKRKWILATIGPMMNVAQSRRSRWCGVGGVGRAPKHTRNCGNLHTSVADSAAESLVQHPGSASRAPKHTKMQSRDHRPDDAHGALGVGGVCGAESADRPRPKTHTKLWDLAHIRCRLRGGVIGTESVLLVKLRNTHENAVFRPSTRWRTWRMRCRRSRWCGVGRVDRAPNTHENCGIWRTCAADSAAESVVRSPWSWSISETHTKMQSFDHRPDDAHGALGVGGVRRRSRRSRLRSKMPMENKRLTHPPLRTPRRSPWYGVRGVGRTPKSHTKNRASTATPQSRS